MQKRSPKLSDFIEPFGPRYFCALSYTDLDGWVGLCEGPRGFHCEVVGDTAEECCEVASRRVVQHHGSEECELSYKYSDGAWAQACSEDEQNAEVRAERLACPLCNTEHPDHEHAVRRASAHLN
jgi:hypothetical protein